MSEDGSGITFALANGEQRKAGIIIRTDGIRSALRNYIFPEVEPTFGNVMIIVCTVPTPLVKFPYENYDLAVSINGEAGGFRWLSRTQMVQKCLLQCKFALMNGTRPAGKL